MTKETAMSRRNFLTGTATAGAAVAVAASMAGITTAHADEAGIDWDYEADVVIAGTGAAGITTAMTAADAGSSVIIIEKAPEEYMGGNSRVAMQAFWTPSDVDAAVNYIKDIAGEDHLYGEDDEYLHKFCEYANTLRDWFTENTHTAIADAVLNPEYPNAEDSWCAYISWCEEGQGFQRVWKALYDAAIRKDEITWMFETPLKDFIFNDAGEVIGIEAESDGKTIYIKAHQGVALCTGGYENNDEMKSNYLRAPSSSTWQFCGTPYNTGDGQTICLKHDIKMWHMNLCTAGTFYGIQLPWCDIEEFKACSLGCEIANDYGFIWLNKDGKRFRDETASKAHGICAPEFFIFNDEGWVNAPFWLIFDQEALDNGTIGQYSSYDQWLSMIYGYTFSKDMAYEVEQGVCLKSDTLEGLAEQMGMDPDVFIEAIETYNGYAAEGYDPEFGRTSGLHEEQAAAAATGLQAASQLRAIGLPIYAIECHTIMVNTQGGPQHNLNRQLMHNDGTLIPRLYGCGECGSIWGWCYQGGANLGECMVSGRIAGEEISKLDRWDA